MKLIRWLTGRRRCCCGTVRMLNASGIEIGGTYHRSDGPCYHVEPGTVPYTLRARS